MPNPKEHHAVVGAGLIGGLWALMLAQRGYKVTLYDRRPDPRKAGVDAGRSINLALSDRGWKAMTKAGVDEVVRTIALPVKGRMMHDHSGNQFFQQYGNDDQFIYSVSRGGLNMLLVEEAEKHPNVEVKFDHPCSGYSINDKGTVDVNFKDGSTIVHDRLFGTDGVYSAVRSTMVRNDRFNYTQQYIPHGYKEILMMPNDDGDYRISENGLHIWPRGEFMFMALPNPGGSFTCTLFAPFEGEESFENIKTDEDVVAFYQKHFPDSIEMLPNLIEDWNENPVSSMCNTKCYPWNDGGRVALLGDAAHAIVPFYGQGMNCGFEDCSILSELIDSLPENSSESDWSAMLGEYSRVRKPAADAILDLALHNYIVMRDKTGDPKYQLQKKIEKRIAEAHPDKWKPLYSLVTFSHIPYNEAWDRGELQQAVMNVVMSQSDIETTWESEEIIELAIETLDKFHSDSNSLARPTPLLSVDV
ncbi:MAG: kynurenine 3-monooxygenase [Euryarchaeota archaeon]|nr:kynurenine 3-monooxygenase [Euryarchaeota archaeon]